MSPVKESNPRTAVIAIIGALVAIIGIGALIVFLLQQGSDTGGVQVQLGSDTFDAGPAADRAAAIAKDGPIPFPDPSGGSRDIFLQHLGNDPATGWLAFDARRTGTGRECTLQWNGSANQFDDPCDGTVPADGTGLRHYQVTVNEDGDVIVDLRTFVGT